MSIEREVAVITGASQGIGAALVKAYNERDYRRPAQIFVAVLGASNFTYAEARWTQALPGWDHRNARLASFGIDRRNAH